MIPERLEYLLTSINWEHNIMSYMGFGPHLSAYWILFRYSSREQSASFLLSPFAVLNAADRWACMKSDKRVPFILTTRVIRCSEFKNFSKTSKIFFEVSFH